MKHICAKTRAGVLISLMLAACSGNGASTTIGSTRASVSTGTGRVAFSIVESKASSSTQTSVARRSPKYLSLAATSLTIALNGLSPQSYQLTNCSLSSDGSSDVCPIPTLSAPTGNDTFVVSAYAYNGSVLLGSATVTANVQAGQTTPVPLDLAGSPATVALALSNAAPPVGTSSSLSLTATALDGAGLQIIGQYTAPIDITSSDKSSSYTKLNKTSLDGSSDSITVTYNGTPIPSPGTVTFSTSSTYNNAIALDPGSAPTEVLALSQEVNPAVYPNFGDVIDVVAGNGSGPAPILYTVQYGIIANDLVFENAGRAVAILAGGVGTLEMDSASSSIVSTFSYAPTLSSLTLGPDGNLYVSSVSLRGTTYLSTINVYAPQSVNEALPVRTYFVPAKNTVYQNIPFALARPLIRFDKIGNLWLTGSDGIDEISITGASGPATVVATLPYPTSLKSLTDMQFDSANDLFISDTTASQVVKLSGSGTGTTATVGATLSGVYFNSVGSIAIDGLGNLFVLTKSGNCYDANVFPVATTTGQPVPSRQIIAPGSGCYLGSTIAVYSP